MIENQIHPIITCEHASNKLPEEWRHLFEGAGDVLETHRGWDPGAIQLAKTIAERLGVKLFVHPWSRMLVEPNRSLHHRQLFSEYTEHLSDSERNKLINSFWSPHRDHIKQEIRSAASSGKQVIHIGIHTFTPVWKQKERDLDIGLLYDPKRNEEKRFCVKWKKELEASRPEFKIRMNRPYLGKDDGLTTGLRREFSEENYLGIEIEVNQKYWFRSKGEWSQIADKLAESLTFLQNHDSSES